MKTIRFATLPALLSASLLLSASALVAQDAPPPAPPATPAPGAPAPGGPARPGGFGNLSPQDLQQRIMDMRDASIRTTLKVSDDEWSVIHPLLDKVEKAQFAMLTSGNSGFGGFGLGGNRGGGPNAGGANPGGGNPPARASGFFQTAPEAGALIEAAGSDTATNDDLKAKMAAVRAARKKAQDDLAAARADLQKVLTLKQEAILLAMGILE